MTLTVAGMRSNEPGNMDIEQLRGWATFMDRAVIVSLVVTVLSVTSLATTTWLSFRYGNAVRAHEQAAFDRYKAEMGKHAVELEQKVSTARERTTELERKVSTAQERAVELERTVTTAQGRTTELEQAAADASARAAQAARESASSREQARSAEIDAEEVRKRVAELAKLVKEAGARPPEPSPAPAVETPQPKGDAASAPQPVSAAASPEARPAPTSPVVESLRKYAGTKAAVYVIGEVQDAAPVGATIAGYLGDAGWAQATWTWSGVGGIFGVVVLVRDGSDPATNEAAVAVVEALHAAGFNAAKGDWPAGASWGRFRGMLNGPQTPGPTEAPIRIVIGAKAR
jgi:hypothetical protein